MNKINWGIIGTGVIANNFAKALNIVKEANIYGVASRSIDKATAFANKYKIDHVFADYTAMIADPMVDVIYIAVPNTEHFMYTKACILGGKHVLCEKPVSVNASETRGLMELAKENKVFLMEAMWTKFLPATTCVKEWIDSERIGAIQFMDINFGFSGERDYNSRLFNPELGGGALLDVGIYLIHYATFLMNSLPDQIQSTKYIGISGVDEMNSISFTYKEGALAVLNSAISTRIGTKAIIIGSKGKIVVDDFYRAQKALIYDEEDILIETFYEPFEENGYEYEAMEVNRCIMEGVLENPRNPLSKTIEIMEIMDHIRDEWNLKYPGGR